MNDNYYPIQITSLPPLPNLSAINETTNDVIETVLDYSSGKVVEDYISENYIEPIKGTIIKGSLIFVGVLFLLVGLILLAINSQTGKEIRKIV